MTYPLLFIVGPTAVGKTELAVQLAERARAAGWELPLLNCDSVQVFASVEIGAAKPTAAQLARAPHRLLGHVAEGRAYTAGDYLRDARAEIARAESSGAPGVAVVGGSGFYVQALEKGMPPAPPSDPATRARLEQRADGEGLAALHAELAARDPERAARIHPADRYRIVRALEILALQPLTLTELDRVHVRSRAQTVTPLFAARKIGLTRRRDRLRPVVEARTAAMIAAGLVDETEALRARGLGAWAPMQAVGYREAQAVLDGRLPRSELAAAIATSTMQLAKRQMTWFRRDAEISWYDVDDGVAGDFGGARAAAAEWLDGIKS